MGLIKLESTNATQVRPSWDKPIFLKGHCKDIPAIQIAGTGSSSQIPFFVTACDYTLIGEEFYAASAYLSGSQEMFGSIKGQDYIKVICIIMIFLVVIISLMDTLNLIRFDINSIFKINVIK